jgi:hypothetical protein
MKKLWLNIKIWFTEKVLCIGDCCGSCDSYEKCYKNHVEYERQNTLESPACGDFIGRE